jgi:hypothetical protein
MVGQAFPRRALIILAVLTVVLGLVTGGLAVALGL